MTKASLVLAFLLGCGSGDGYLRGSVTPSPDGKTYLAVVDDTGGVACRTILVDGETWTHSLGEPGEVQPGLHTIECGGKMQFTVPEGVVFNFDYWGP